ncbi:MAG: activase [Chitinivibrionales bacterium]|nr:activase [Chitinivibrionales bacterium]
MMAEKVLDLLEKVDNKRIIAVGGVTLNNVVMKFLDEKVDALHIPEHADVYEALGAACYALHNRTACTINYDHIFNNELSSFTPLPPISRGNAYVTFGELTRGTAQAGDECIVGLDVGSTTTKAVVLRTRDNALLASVYLRTSGNPVKAARQCYAELDKQLKAAITFNGLAVTGSGRQIAGLHAGTDAIINEIIAHATGAAFFDKEVDTIFEIGGQDAKFTCLTNAVPSDYAMNEACSAGTGSFLEESARESLGIHYLDIEKIAQQGINPPNFNDQCAAFISSDIKTATHEGISREDIVAGLVYSICMNYVNRVKGQRRIGRKIFMQGGVCYNKAVPLAMANLIEHEIIVPPEPGLIGAFGVALELKDRIASGFSRPQAFDLKSLAARDIDYGKSFACAGGKEKCDRSCEINIMIIDGKKYPFGGACNKYYNQVHHLEFDEKSNNLVKQRQNFVFDTFVDRPAQPNGKKIGIPRSYFTNTFLPLFQNFFTGLGYEIVLSDDVDPQGIKRRRSAFCYPGEIAHGCYANLLKKKLDYIFIPRIIEMHVENSVSDQKEHQCTCLLLQSEAYWLKSAFKGNSVQPQLLSPVLNFSKGLQSQEHVFANLAGELGQSRRNGRSAFRFGLDKYHQFSGRIKEEGQRVLAELEHSPAEFAVVLFGRSYNAFANEANMGIPTKFASRGVKVIPWDYLPVGQEACDENMCWAMGQYLWKAANYVKKHPQLFGVWITNFSCGPDSFLLGYFRDILGIKPSLTLELDSHTADAGINTRIEAFLDIVERFRELDKKEETPGPFQSAKVIMEKKQPVFVTSDNQKVSLYDKRVHLLLPSMGPFFSEIFESILTGAGIRTSAIPVYTFDTLKVGRANSSCKECLPLQLTVGGLLRYLNERSDPDELLVYFMPTTGGNCRFTQYSVFMNRHIEKNQIPNVALLSLTTENSYLGLPFDVTLNLLKGTIISDVLDDISNALQVLAVDKVDAAARFQREFARIKECYRNGASRSLYAVLGSVAENLRSIPLRYPLSRARIVSMMGEIFVRRDHFSCQNLIEKLAEREIILKRSHIFEWLKYIDYMVQYDVYEPRFNLKSRFEYFAKRLLQRGYERKIKRILARSGLFDYELVDMKKILAYGRKFFDIHFTGESIIVAGAFFKEVLHSVHGVISIGPFACMPTRVIEAVLSAESNYATKKMLDTALGNGHHRGAVEDIHELPFLSIESDGNPFPQIVQARIEAFCLQVERLHARLHATQKFSNSEEKVTS